MTRSKQKTAKQQIREKLEQQATKEAGAIAKREVERAEEKVWRVKQQAEEVLDDARRNGSGARDETVAEREARDMVQPALRELAEMRALLKQVVEANPHAVALTKAQFESLGLKKTDVATSSPKPKAVDTAEKKAAAHAAEQYEVFRTKVEALIDASCQLTLDSTEETRANDENTIREMMEKVKKCAEIFHEIVPDGDELTQHHVEKAISMMAGHLATVQKLMPVPTCWEELESDEPTDGYERKDRIIADMLLGVKVEHPFHDEKITIEQAASHPQCNASRLATNMHLVVSASKRAVRMPRKPGEIVAVVDVGSGAFGAERLAMARRVPQWKGVHYHAMMTCVDNEDMNRLAAAREKYSNMARWHHVTPLNPPKLNCLNYCHHTAAECTCLAMYDHIQLVSNHVLYCLKPPDYANLFKHASDIRGAVHIPVFDGDQGSFLPVQEPEYQWLDATKFGGWFRRARARVKQALTGDRQTVLASVKTGTTVYEQPDIGPMIARGGFHMGPTLMAASHLDSIGKFTKIASIGAATAASAAFLQCPGSVTVKAAQAVVAAVSSVAVAAAATRAGHQLAKCEQPPPFTEYTVRSHITDTYSISKTHEPVAHIVRLQRCTPQELVPVRTHNTVVDGKQVSRAQAGLLAGGDSPKTEQQIHANLARDGVPAWVARDSMQQAKRLVSFLFSPVREPAPPPGWRHGMTALVCLPFAWATSKWATWTLRAVLQRQSVQIAGPTPLLSTANTWALLPLALLFPTLWCYMLAVGAFVALLAWA